MPETADFLIRHGYLFLFVAVLADQVGLPIPAAPILLAAGALARGDRMSLAAAIALSTLATVISDLVLFEVGRRKGSVLLRWLCRIAIEPDSCVRRTEITFGRNGRRTLIAAKFVPGLNLAAPPLAAMLGMPLHGFLVWDGAAALLWSASFLVTGFVFSEQIARIAELAMGLGKTLALVLGALLGAYLALKAAQRILERRRISVPRISPEEVKLRIDEGGGMTIIDIRHPVEYEASRERIAGAIHIPKEELEARISEIPAADRIVLYCT